MLAAAIVTFAACGLGAVQFGLLSFGLLFDRSDAINEIEKAIKDDRAVGGDFDASTLATVYLVIGLVSLLVSLTAMVFAVFTMRGERRARLGLVILAGVSALASLLGGSPISLVASLGVIALLFTPTARAWFAQPEPA